MSINIVLIKLLAFKLFFTHQVNGQQPVEYTPIVELSDGKVRGIVQEAFGKQVYFYQGIRYGRAKRFENPEPEEPWPGVYDATEWRDACPQWNIEQPIFGLFAQTSTISEDCLFLNVWSPKSWNSNRDVMVFIYGGTFFSGTIFTELYDAKYLAVSGDVVLVTLNYRLGAFGFLYADRNYQGNYGLHDQILALHWVQNNIVHFGGDANKVTIFGWSVGSASVGAMILSPLAKGLFHRAIMQSGAITSLTRVTSPATQLDNTKWLAREIGCRNNNRPAAIVKCLRGKSIDQILTITQNGPAINRYFVPIYTDQVLPLKPSEALLKGQFNHNIDILFGLTRDEGIRFVNSTFLPCDGKINLRTTRNAIVDMMNFIGVADGELVADYYMRSLHNPSKDDLKLTIANAWGDYNLVCPEILFTEYYAQHSTHNSYYSYRLLQPISIEPFCLRWMGVCHAADLFYLFVIPNKNSQFRFTLGQRLLSRDMLSAWTSFAKTGQVNLLGWKNAFGDIKSDTKPDTRYFALQVSHYKIVYNFYKETCGDFWMPLLFDNVTRF